MNRNFIKTLGKFLLAAWAGGMAKMLANLTQVAA